VDGLDAGLFVVAYPAINAACHAALESYGATLAPARDTFEGRTLEDLVAVMDQAIDAPWVSEFRERYLTPK
jgi:hypothetical protein